MNLSERPYSYISSLVLFALSALLIFAGAPQIWAPFPMHLVVLGFLGLFFFPLITPAVHLVSIRYLYPTRYFVYVVLITTITIGLLNLQYLKFAWNYGQQWQGAFHTLWVAIENATGFTIAISIAVIAAHRDSKVLALWAQFAVLAMLSWCAFPYLGELP